MTKKTDKKDVKCYNRTATTGASYTTCKDKKTGQQLRKNKNMISKPVAKPVAKPKKKKLVLVKPNVTALTERKGAKKAVKTTTLTPKPRPKPPSYDSITKPKAKAKAKTAPKAATKPKTAPKSKRKPKETAAQKLTRKRAEFDAEIAKQKANFKAMLAAKGMTEKEHFEDLSAKAAAAEPASKAATKPKKQTRRPADADVVDNIIYLRSTRLIDAYKKKRLKDLGNPKTKYANRYAASKGIELPLAERKPMTFAQVLEEPRPKEKGDKEGPHSKAYGYFTKRSYDEYYAYDDYFKNVIRPEAQKGLVFSYENRPKKATASYDWYRPRKDWTGVSAKDLKEADVGRLIAKKPRLQQLGAVGGAFGTKDYVVSPADQMTIQKAIFDNSQGKLSKKDKFDLEKNHMRKWEDSNPRPPYKLVDGVVLSAPASMEWSKKVKAERERFKKTLKGK